ncbi:MAG: ABC transporter ATP-binding protein [Coriobacteriales bacterium]|jgi:ABC-2 type transport system ATP-binding protein|nr:ABC transporter ATP-binding protein [Coriobacteriales bacterium]
MNSPTNTADTANATTDASANLAPPTDLVSPANLVSLVGVHKRFGRQEVLSGIDLRLSAGSITGLLGPSGCGKTTLVNIIVGMSRANQGAVEVLGERPPFRRARRRLGFMPQGEALYLDLTARENLRFFGALYGMSGRELDEAIPQVLALARLEDTGRKTIANFSGGMKRRLSLAIALLHSPQLLVLDEPTVGLDPEHRLELWRAFRTLAHGGSGLLITTHVMDEASSCDEIVMLRDGRIIAQGSPTKLMRQSDASSLEAAFLAFEGAEEVHDDKTPKEQGTNSQSRETSARGGKESSDA